MSRIGSIVLIFVLIFALCCTLEAQGKSSADQVLTFGVSLNPAKMLTALETVPASGRLTTPSSSYKFTVSSQLSGATGFHSSQGEYGATSLPAGNSRVSSAPFERGSKSQMNLFEFSRSGETPVYGSTPLLITITD